MSNNNVQKELTAADASHIGGFVIKSVIPFLSMRYFAFLLSGGIIIAGLIMGIIHKGFDLGIDFKGGVKVEVVVNQTDINITQVRDSLTKGGLESEVTTVGKVEDKHFMVTLPVSETASTAEVESAKKILTDSFGQQNINILGTEVVEAKMGSDFMTRAVQLLLLVLGLIVIYIIFRFDLYYSVGAFVATIHDMLIMLAFAIFFRIPIDITIIAAILTIMGYSINDTIVVYDRIREMVGLHKEEDLEHVMDKSVTQTLSRTIITVLTVIFVDLAIYFWGGIVLHNFAFLLLVGLISGTYSSIFMSAPVVFLAKRAFDKNFHGKKAIAKA